MDRTHDNWLQEHPIVVFLVIANGISVTAACLGYTESLGLAAPARTFLAYLAKFGPSLGAVCTALILGGVPACRSLLIPLTCWRISWIWWMVILFGPLVLWILLYGIVSLVGTGAGPVYWMQIYWYVPFILRRLFIGGGLGEEIGWRGLMLPLLQKRWGPIRASLMVGLFWGLWHTPAFFFTGTGKSGGFANILLFTVLCTVLSVYFTWVYNGSGGSLLWVAGFHACVSAGMDVAERLFPEFEGTVWFGLTLLLLAVVVVAVTNLSPPPAVPITNHLTLRRLR